MEHSGNVVLELFLMFAGGKFLAEIFERLRQPAVVGELIAGILLGPSLLSLIHPNELTLGLAEIGAIFLLFTVGLETKPRDMLQVGWISSLVAVLGVVLPFALGFIYMRAIDHNMIESIFVGAAMVATSVGITARVLADVGVLSTRVARVILGAAVIDDILGMIVLAVVSSLTEGRVNYVSLAVVAGEAIVFSALIIFLLVSSFTINSINCGVHFPSSSAIPAQVADLINLFGRDMVPILFGSNNVFIWVPLQVSCGTI